MQRQSLFAASVVTFCLIIALAVVGVQGTQRAQALPLAACDRGSQPISSAFQFPVPAKTVDQWVDTQNIPKMREHGWYLFAGLNQPATAPQDLLWRTWCTSTQAFAANSGGGVGMIRAQGGSHQQRDARLMSQGLQVPEPIFLPGSPTYGVPAEVVKDDAATCPSVTKSQIDDGPTFQNNGDIMVANVAYSRAAYEWIRSQGLYNGTILKRFVPTSPSAQGDMPAMPEAGPTPSVVLKPMWWPVKKNGFTALPIWNFTGDSSHGKYAGFENHQIWPNGVAVTQEATMIVPSSVTFLYDVRGAALPSPGPTPTYMPTYTFHHPQVVSTSRFYTIVPNLSKLQGCDRAILDSSAWWTYHRRFQQGDALVLIAMHIMTKERRAWTFQSFWWSQNPTGPYAANKPTSIPGSQVWRNYLLTSTYGLQAFFSTPTPTYSSMPTAMNPYIELAATHPIQTNCFNCHHRAAYPESNSGFGTIFANYLATPLPGTSPAPGARDFYHARDRIFNGLERTDAMWAIPDRVSPPQP